MSTVYGYGRHSTDKQGLTEQAQRAQVERYVQLHLDDCTWGGWIYDAAVSGGKDLFERAKGRELLVLAQPGDHIVFAKLDRAFRKVTDGISTLAMLSQKGVRVHILDLGIDTSTPMGECALTIVLAFAQLQRKYTSERTKEALEVKRKAGLPYNKGVPFGWKKVGSGKTGRFVPCTDERDQCVTILGYKAAGFSYDKIVELMIKVRRPNGRRWNRNSVRLAAMAARKRFPKSLPTAPPLDEDAA